MNAHHQVGDFPSHFRPIKCIIFRKDYQKLDNFDLLFMVSYEWLLYRGLIYPLLKLKKKIKKFMIPMCVMNLKFIRIIRNCS